MKGERERDSVLQQMSHPSVQSSQLASKYVWSRHSYEFLTSRQERESKLHPSRPGKRRFRGRKRNNRRAYLTRRLARQNSGQKGQRKYFNTGPVWRIGTTKSQYLQKQIISRCALILRSQQYRLGQIFIHNGYPGKITLVASGYRESAGSWVGGILRYYLNSVSEMRYFVMAVFECTECLLLVFC